MKAVLRLGHNYVGTEHLLLGVLFADVAEARILEAKGVTVERIEEALAAEFERIKAQRAPDRE
jgi:ATP-dependent Clp protease ATP-binding subunit ClpA